MLWLRVERLKRNWEVYITEYNRQRLHSYLQDVQINSKASQMFSSPTRC